MLEGNWHAFIVNLSQYSHSIILTFRINCKWIFMSISKQGNACRNLRTFCKEITFIVQTNHQQRPSKTKQINVLSEKLDKRGRGGSRKGWGEQHVQGGPSLKDSEGYRSVQKQNIREMLKGKGIGEREASRTLQGMDNLHWVQAQHKESGICK